MRLKPFSLESERTQSLIKIMKHGLIPKFLASIFVLCFCAVFNSVSSHAAVFGFSVSPTNVDQTYAGTITLQFNGPSGSTVLIQKFADYNGNGVVDSNDLMVQSFTVTDNSATVIGGVTNTSVPGDSDPSNGNIKIKLNAANNGLLPGATGKFIYKLTVLSNSFSPAYQSLTVSPTTNAGYGTVTGQIKSGGSPVPNAFILVATPPNNGSGFVSAGGTFADANGDFTVKVVPGTYVAAGFKSNYVANLNSATSFVVTAGGTVSNNLTLQPATESISGRLFDTNSNAGLAGVLVAATDSNYDFVAGFTDSNGDYTLPAINGNWNMEGNERALGMLGYLSLQGSARPSFVVNNSPVTGVNMGFQKATAMIYGRVLDNFGNPVANLDFGGYGNNSTFSSEAMTDTNGYYYLGTDSTGNDTWSAQLNTPLNPAPVYYALTLPANSISLTPGQALEEDFSAVAAPYTITGKVTVTNGTPIVGVLVFPSTYINGTNYQAPPGVTDSNGMYQVYVSGNALWYLTPDCYYNNNNLDHQGFLCLDSEYVKIGSANGTANFATVPYSDVVDELDGTVNDGNGNPVAGATVYAVNPANNQTNQTTTDVNGFYYFFVTDETSWNLNLNCAQLSNRGYSCPGTITNAIIHDRSTCCQNFTIQSGVAPFFTGEIALSTPGWYWLGPQGANTYGFGYYSAEYAPYIFHQDLGWEYFVDAGDANHGAYFYDFTDGAYFYTTPAIFPYLYDFKAHAWMFYSPLTSSTDRYSSNPRWFYNYTTHAWVNHL